MTNARPAPCFITFHTSVGALRTTTEQLIPEPDNPSSPEAVAHHLVDYLRKWGFVLFKDEDRIESVFSAGLYRMTVESE